MDDALGVKGFIYELNYFQNHIDGLQFWKNGVTRLVALDVLFDLNLVSLDMPGASVYLEVTWGPDWLAICSNKFECV
jgi:hypothetical protein